jgi:hypothetical protein
MSEQASSVCGHPFEGVCSRWVNPSSSLRPKRLALCIGAVAAVSAMFSGPAYAEGGLTGLLTGTAEQLPPLLAQPVADVASTLAPVEQALPPLAQKAVDDVAETTGAVVETTGGVVESVLPPAPEVTPPATGNPLAPPAEATPVADAPVSAPEAAASAAPPADVTVTPVEAAAPPVEEQEMVAPIAPPAASLVQPAQAALLPLPDVRAPEATPAARDHRRPRPESTTQAGHTAPGSAAQEPIAALPAVTKAPDAARAPFAPFWPWPDVPLPGFSVLSLTAGAAWLVFSALLALLLLAAPAAHGTLLRAGVAKRRSADVQFRLVRPG